VEGGGDRTGGKGKRGRVGAGRGRERSGECRGEPYQHYFPPVRAVTLDEAGSDAERTLF